MHPTRPILVVGATGKTGARVAARLEAAGAPVRRLSRRAPIPFDWDRPATWPAAFEGAAAAYVTYHPDIAIPGALAKIEQVCAVARAADLERLVLLTGRGERHAQLAEDVARGSGVESVIVRAAWFAQNFSEGQLRDPVMAGVLPMPGGDVREPIVDIDDIADVAAAALTEERHAGELYEVTGPRLMSFAEMAEALSAAIGRPVRRQPLSFEDFRAAIAETAGATIADVITAVARETLDGRNAWVADGVERALGRPPRDFAAFAAAAARAGAWAEAA